MKILHLICTQDLGGSERYAAVLANAQAKSGHSVRLLLRPQKRGQPSILDFLDPEVERAVLHKFFSRWQLRKHADYFQPDICHAHLGKAAKLLGKTRLPCPKIATLHLRYQPKNYSRLDGLIGIAPWQQEAMSAYTGKTAIIGGWIEESPPVPPTKQQALRASLNCPAEAPLLGTVSRLHADKRVDWVIDAFIALNHPTAHLLIVGDGLERRALEHRAGTHPRIHFLGYQLDIPLIMQTLDLFISASAHEAFGLTYVEAMAAGCPLLATPTAGARAVLQGQPAVLLAEDTPDALQKALKTMLAQPLARLSYNLEPFQKATQVEKIERFYQRVIDASQNDE